jgi:hypothetical protein
MTAPALKLKVAFRTCRRREDPTPAQEKPSAQSPATASIARRLALGHHIEALIDRGALRDYRDAAERLGITTARISQVCDLALLAPAIQAAVLLGHVEPRDRHLHAVGRHPLWTDQMRAFQVLFPHVRLETES